MNIQYTFEKRADLVESVLSAGLAVAEMYVDGTRKIVVTCLSMGATCAVDIESLGIITQLIDGRDSDAFSGLTYTTLTAKEITETSLAVADESDFAAGDIVAVMNYGDGTSLELEQVASTSSDTIVLEQALTGTFYKNALVIKLDAAKVLLGMGIGFNRKPGVRAQHEAPTAPLFEVEDGAADSIDVTITDPELDSAVYFDVYVRESTTRPDWDPLWEPDAKDKTVAQIASAVNILTHGGGADFVPDGTGAALASSDVVWVGVVAKDGTGLADVKRSPIDWVKHTLD